MNRFFTQIPEYLHQRLRSDIVAGATVSVLAVPQSMAYAILAGLHPVYGLHTAIVSTFFGSLLRSSSHVISGTTTAVSILTASYMAPFVGMDNFYSMLFLLTLLTGLFQILFGLMRAGDLEQYVSPSVLLGFTLAAAMLIGFGQLPNFFGITVEPQAHFLLKIKSLIMQHANTNYMTIWLGGGTLLAVLIFQRIHPRFPAHFIAIVLGALAVYGFQLEDKGVQVVGDIPRHLPLPHLIPISLGATKELLNGAFALAVIGLIEGLSSAKIIAAKTGQVISPNRELFGQGVANISGALFQGMPSGGSFSRSALNYQSGGKTRMAGIFAAAASAVLLVTCAPMARYIPVASLAAVLMAVSWQLVDWNRVKTTLQSTHSDMIVLFSTLGSGIIISIETAVYVGIIISVALFLRKASVLDIRKLLQSEPGRFYEVDYQQDVDMSTYTILQIEGDLFFGAAGDLERKLQHIFRKGRPIILRMKRTHNIDFAALEVLHRFNDQVTTNGGLLILTGAEADVRKSLLRFGLDKSVGTENFFFAGEVMFQSMQCAIKRAEEFVQNKNRVCDTTDPIHKTED
jgi:sulfate permease, SulP family